jgi:hypothetical protein
MAMMMLLCLGCLVPFLTPLGLKHLIPLLLLMLLSLVHLAPLLMLLCLGHLISLLLLLLPLMLTAKEEIAN